MGLWTGRLAIVGMLATAIAGCQALKDTLPTKPSDPKPAPSQSPVSIPVVLPQATPTPVLGGPAPAPTPTPANPGPNPTPAPTPAPPTGGSCSLPPSSNPNDSCTMQSPAFLSPVDKAITLLTQQQPSIFNFNNNICENCYFVKDVSAYTAGVIKNLNAAGYCAKYDGEELGVKNTNSFNEQYDILISSGHIRRGAGSYRSTCNPAWF
jgi:hypothetical protein